MKPAEDRDVHAVDGRVTWPTNHKVDHRRTLGRIDTLINNVSVFIRSPATPGRLCICCRCRRDRILPADPARHREMQKRYGGHLVNNTTNDAGLEGAFTSMIKHAASYIVDLRGDAAQSA
jgi:hypothetical protein